VLFAVGAARSAAAVARRLGIRDEEPLGSQLRARARHAAVVVLVGADQPG